MSLKDTECVNACSYKGKISSFSSSNFKHSVPHAGSLHDALLMQLLLLPSRGNFDFSITVIRLSQRVNSQPSLHVPK